jgi:protein-S-isoprenylcysteine O-methyltransferase Ste14
MDLAKAMRDPWVWGQTALMLLVAVAAPLLPRYVNLGEVDFLLNRIDPVWIRALGGLIIVAGVVKLVGGVRSLGRNITPGIEPLPDAELITTGAYAYSRHPIYAGVVLILTGYTLAWSNWTLALVVGWIALQYFNAKARAEERWLLQRFPGYRSYLQRVHRRVL